ncbi:hypothetical protein ABH931_006152 [Streptacidiphilus sp. MAP12-33]|uniref:hypothetical protein n=1 Tax=Streptacidiphilus sp. MAP12-33 TaxID=3156266 RepID=UPI003515FF98
MKAKGHVKKHAGSHKHHKTAKHNPVVPPAASAPGAFVDPGASLAVAAAHVHAVKKHPHHAKASKWSPLADVACCAAEALAASARLAGRAVSDADVLALYWLTATGPDEGATLEATIEAAGVFGLGGARLAAARPASALGTGTVLGVDLTERHALTVDRHGVWTWGAWRPASCGLLEAADEAWELTWQ